MEDKQEELLEKYFIDHVKDKKITTLIEIYKSCLKFSNWKDERDTNRLAFTSKVENALVKELEL